MKTVPAVIFYRCQGYYLYHKYGEFTEQLGRKHKTSPACAEHWESLKGTVPQDAFAQLLAAFKDVQKRYELFTTDYFLPSIILCSLFTFFLWRCRFARLTLTASPNILNAKEYLSIY